MSKFSVSKGLEQRTVLAVFVAPAIKPLSFFKANAVLGLACLVLFVCLLSEPLQANDQAVTDHQKRVETMLELMGVPKQVDQAAMSVIEQYNIRFDPMKADSNLADIVTAYQKDLRKIIYPVLGWNGLKTTYIYNYSKRLNKQEVDSIIGFYLSSAGKKLIGSQPEVNKEIKEITEHLVVSDIKQPLEDLTKLFQQAAMKHQMLKNQQAN